MVRCGLSFVIVGASFLCFDCWLRIVGRCVWLYGGVCLLVVSFSLLFSALLVNCCLLFVVLLLLVVCCWSLRVVP